MDIDTRYINQIEVIINVFSIVDGNLKILLFKRDEEPFKNYWMLPSNLLMTSETIEECAISTIEEFINIKNIYLEQCSVISKIDRLPNDRIIANSLIGIIDYNLFKKSKKRVEYGWFNINDIPKTVYDHEYIINDALSYLKKNIKNKKLLEQFFPSDFTMPELQKFYEEVLDEKLDRRNFRKKMISLDIIEDTGDKNISQNGRPPKLYRLKEREN